MNVMMVLADKHDSVVYMSQVELTKNDTLAFIAVKQAFNKQLGSFYSGQKWEDLVQQVDEGIDCLLSYKEII